MIKINKIFWKAIKSSLTNKNCPENGDVILRDDEKMITVEKKLVQLFNDRYINIAERSCGFKPEKVEFNIGSYSKNGILSSILDKYPNHPSIVEVHKNMSLQSSSISIPSSSWDSKVKPKEIKTILKFLNSKKAPEIDKIPNKLAELASDILAKPSISFYISILKELQYATCLVKAFERMKRTLEQQ